MTINLTLENESSIYESIECVEFVDNRLLNGFINNKMGVNYGIDPKDAFKFKLYDNEHKQILAYMKQKKVNKKNCYTVKQDLPLHKWGRVLPAKYLSLSVFQRKTRHALCQNKYIDIDMVNCHSNIYLYIAEQNDLKHSTLQEYCINPKKFRDSIIKTHFPNNEFNDIDKKTFAKNLLISLSNGGSYNSWKRKHNIEFAKDMKIVKDYECELANIRDLIYKYNPNICNDIIKYDINHFKKYENNETNLLNARKRTTMALYGQTVERHIQEKAIQFVVDTYKIKLQHIVSCQDGFMILKTAFSEDMIDEINNYIEESIGISIEFVVKEFDEAITIEPSDYLNDEYTLTELEKYYSMSNLMYTEIHQPKIDISYTEFSDNQTVILQSGTGTCKTEIASRLCSNYKYVNQGYKILCLSNLTTILDQVHNTFTKDNINLIDYRNVHIPSIKITKEEYDETIDDYIITEEWVNTDGTKLINNDSFICINSLWKLHNEDFKNTILIIDEPNNVLFNLTNNKTMTKSKVIMQTFLRLFKTCHKVVLLDAHFNKSIEELILIRDKSYTYYINTYQKFQDTPCIKLTDNQLIDKLKDKLDNGHCFVFASDSKAKCEGIYNLLYDYTNETMQKKFKLITRDTDVNITEIDYNDSIIFISPKVVCGVSIITKTYLDSFIYICGESITPIALYQQATRLRTMKNLYYCDNTIIKTNNYKSYEDCERKITDLMLNYESIINNSTLINDVGILKIDANYYFKLHVQNEYLTSLNKEDTLKIFEKELKNAGFAISDECNNEKNTMKTIIKENKELYLDKQMMIVSDQLSVMLTDEEKENSTYLKTCNYLNITTPKQFELYTDFVKYDQVRNEFDMFTRLCRTDEYIESKVDIHNINRHNIETNICVYYKIKMIRLFEGIYNISPMNFYSTTYDYKEPDVKNKKVISKILKLFDTKYSKIKIPTDNETIYKVYGRLIENCIGKTNFSQTSIRVGDNKRLRIPKYNESINTYINLMKLKYTTFNSFNNSIISMLVEHSKIELPITPITPINYNA